MQMDVRDLRDDAWEEKESKIKNNSLIAYIRENTSVYFSDGVYNATLPISFDQVVVLSHLAQLPESEKHDRYIVRFRI